VEKQSLGYGAGIGASLGALLGGAGGHYAVTPEPHELHRRGREAYSLDKMKAFADLFGKEAPLIDKRISKIRDAELLEAALPILLASGGAVGGGTWAII